MLYVTTSDHAEAQKIGRSLLEENLAACVNIIDGMTSMYKWKGEIQEDKECILIVKTHYSRVQRVTRLIKEMHSYEVPAVLSLTITEDEGNVEYLDWLEKESKQPFKL
ncbi:MAG TPA: divalent-cation tolerance protein CutA [Balneolaceae bacterium]|nr:divalent-cation tolerance protein CutA [Balneola sp.]HBQ60967.1 divalent-cation tolerance protein CutA [Balneolaceae bacterium]